MSNIQMTLSDYFSHQPIEKAWLFGSYARGEAGKHSDIDILVSFTSGSNVSLLKYTRIVNDLQKLLQKRVDMVEEGQLLDFAEKSAQRDKILIYERDNKG